MTAENHGDFVKSTNKASRRGLFAKTEILTMGGYVRVENLREGDRIVTRSGVRVLRHVEVNKTQIRPVTVGASTLGHNRPEIDMQFAPDQEVLVRDWRALTLFGTDQAMLPISRLVDDEMIVRAEQQVASHVFSLHFDHEEVVYANGVEVVSGLGVKDAAQIAAQKAA